MTGRDATNGDASSAGSAASGTARQGRRPARLAVRLFAVACAILAAACLVGQFSGGNVILLLRDGPGPTEVEVDDGHLAVFWEPRVSYRPQWAGQTNRFGFRYNLYSDGSGYAWAPLWVPAVALAGVAVLAGHAGRRRRPRAGFCQACGYDMRATPERCPECGYDAGVSVMKRDFFALHSRRALTLLKCFERGSCHPEVPRKDLSSVLRETREFLRCAQDDRTQSRASLDALGRPGRLRGAVTMSLQHPWDYRSLLVETKGFFARGVIDVSTLDAALADHGNAGWELVAVVPVSDGNVGTARLLCTFKRPRPPVAT